MQKKLLVLASIISIITATATSAGDSSELERLRSEAKRRIEERKIDEQRRAKELERLDEQIGQKERGLSAWKRSGYSDWAGPSEKVEAERAAMAAFDCMFLAVRGGADHAGDAERLFTYARERAKQALPYTDSPYSFTPYKHPGTISDDFWIGTLFSDARARIDRLFADDDSSSLRVWGSSKAVDEFERRNCRFIGNP